MTAILPLAPKRGMQTSGEQRISSGVGVTVNNPAVAVGCESSVGVGLPEPVVGMMGTAVQVGVDVLVSVGVLVGVWVGDDVGVAVGVRVGVVVGVAVSVGEGVRVIVGMVVGGMAVSGGKVTTADWCWGVPSWEGIFGWVFWIFCTA